MSNSIFSGQSNFKEIVDDLRALYVADPRPWLVGFSGGKDSTLVGALVTVNYLLSFAGWNAKGCRRYRDGDDLRVR